MSQAEPGRQCRCQQVQQQAYEQCREEDGGSKEHLAFQHRHRRVDAIAGSEEIKDPVAPSVDGHPGQEESYGSADERQPQILLDDQVEQCAPLGTEGLADGHLRQTVLHPGGHHAAEVQGRHQQKQHDGERHVPPEAVAVVRQEYGGEALPDFGIVRTDGGRKVDGIVRIDAVVACLHFFQFLEEGLALVLCYGKANSERDVLIGKGNPIHHEYALGHVRQVDVGTAVLCQHGWRFHDSTDAVFPVVEHERSPLFQSLLPGQVLGDDRHAAAAVHIVLRERRPAYEAKLIKAEEGWVGDDGVHAAVAQAIALTNVVVFRVIELRHRRRAVRSLHRCGKLVLKPVPYHRHFVLILK